MACGSCTNFRAKLLALWGILFCARRWNLVSLQVFGDSWVIIDWVKGSACMQVILLEGWKHRIREVQTYKVLSSLSLLIIYRGN